MTIEPGTWITCYASPDSVAKCLPLPGAKRIAGSVVECTPLPNFMPGNIPDCSVKLRGRTGKTLTLSFTACYGQTHATKAEAIASVESP